MSVVIRLKVPIEMHYTVITMGTSKVNSSQVSLPCCQRFNLPLLSQKCLDLLGKLQLCYRFAGFKVPGSSEDEDEFLSLHELQSCGQNNCVLR